MVVGCSKIDEVAQADKFVVEGYSNIHTRTSFGTPGTSEIPFLWSKGDYIYLGTAKSAALGQGGQKATFEFATAPSGNAVYYNMTGTANKAKVLSVQSADSNLGNDGDFGCATLTNNSFSLEHKTAYIWFNTTTTDSDMPKLSSITFEAPAGVNIAGESTYDGAWGAVENGNNSIQLKFEGGKALQASNDGVMAAMVCLPALVAGQTVKITYAFEGGKVYVEEKTLGASTNFGEGVTTRFTKTINKSDLTEPLRVLTFEGDKWDALIDTKQMNGDILYGGDWSWYDTDNTGLCHIAYESGAWTYACGGHTISNYTEPYYAPDYLQVYLEKYYDASELYGYEGWQFLQLMTPCGAHSGDNFAVHFGYIDQSGFSMCADLPAIEFEDGEPRVIDHMYVTNTNYALNQAVYGVSREDNAGDQFGGDYDGINPDTYLKVVAYGFANTSDEEPTTEAKFDLVKDGEAVTSWQKWDLSGLGAVAKVKFNFEFSADMGGDYGFTIPAYFAYDDVAVRFEN